jgi:hypothetical protein
MPQGRALEVPVELEMIEGLIVVGEEEPRDGDTAVDTLLLVLIWNFITKSGGWCSKCGDMPLAKAHKSLF